MILPLCSVLKRPHLEYCVHMKSPQCRRDMDPLEHMQRMATRKKKKKKNRRIKRLTCEDRLRELGLFSPEK